MKALENALETAVVCEKTHGYNGIAGGEKMIIQSKKVWFADQFVAAQIEVEDGKITGVYQYGTKTVDKD